MALAVAGIWPALAVAEICHLAVAEICHLAVVGICHLDRPLPVT
jgi:hypothetical protein